jgi:hypothetical protein
LVAIEYLSRWEFLRNERSSDFKLALSPGKRLLSLPNFAMLGNPDPPALPEGHLPPWVGELVRRGVAEKKARQLALDTPDSQPVLDQIEYAEHLIAADQRMRSKIANPAGFLIWAIENNLSVPADFQTSRKQSLSEARQQEANEQRFRLLQLRNDYDEYCDQQTRKRLESEYPGERLELALREQMKAIKRDQPDWFGRMPETTRRQVAMARLRTALRERMRLPAFEDWASKAQAPLF